MARANGAQDAPEPPLLSVFTMQPTRAQRRALKTACEQARLLANAALEARVSARGRGVRIRRFDRARSLTKIRGARTQWGPADPSC